MCTTRGNSACSPRRHGKATPHDFRSVMTNFFIDNAHPTPPHDRCALARRARNHNPCTTTYRYSCAVSRCAICCVLSTTYALSLGSATGLTRWTSGWRMYIFSCVYYLCFCCSLHVVLGIE